MPLRRPDVLPEALEQHAADVDVIEEREADEETGEGVAHLLREEHGDHHAVGEEAEQA